jgi:mono/diheme cytochrome c family protein
MSRMKKAIPVIVPFLLAAAWGLWAAAEVPDNVKALFGQRCAGCHKGNSPPKGLNLEPANVAAILDAPSREVPGLKIVDTKAPEASYLLKKVRRESGIAGKPMPPGKALAADQLQVLEAWVDGLK